MKYLFLLLLPLVVYGQNKGMIPTKPNGETERRLALVIGNKDYSASPLKNSLNDADDISSSLRDLGFKVLLYKNLERVSLEEVIDNFSKELKNYDVGLFYYSGHGIQAQGETYMVPTDVKELEAEARVRSKCVNLEYVLTSFEGAGTKTSLVFLDACRNNPFKKGWGKSFEKQGLSIPSYNPAGNIVVYATDAGSTADDNANDRNGLFTKCLLRYLSTPNLTLNTILNKTRQDVQKINPNQYPKEYGGLMGDFYFILKPTDNSELELERKKRLELERKLAELENNTKPINAVIPQKKEQNTKKYLDLPFAEMMRIPGGTFEMGDTRIEGEEDEKPVHTVTLSSFFMGKYEVTVQQFGEFVAATNYQTDAEKDGGSYFWSGKEWKKRTGIDWRKDASGLKLAESNHPVVHVSHNDAVEFCKWLSKREGIIYRLPTEAEWEYSAGGGQRHTRYAWGDELPKAKVANLADEIGAKALNWTKNEKNIFLNYEDGYVYTSPVGVFSANVLGLYDMTGNVNEWCSDWYGNYSNSPSTNPIGASSGTSRVLRGGSWYYGPQYCRVAFRFRNTPPSYRDTDAGFRVVSP